MSVLRVPPEERFDPQDPDPLQSSRRLVRSLTILWVSLAGLVLLLVVGVVWWQAADKNESSQTQDLVSELNSYPADYLQRGLPRYPGGEITHLGAADGEASGSLLYIKTSDQPSKVESFFERELEKLGWSLEPELSRSSGGVISQVYAQAAQQFHLTITNDAKLGSSNIIISWQ